MTLLSTEHDQGSFFQGRNRQPDSSCRGWCRLLAALFVLLAVFALAQGIATPSSGEQDTARTKVRDGDPLQGHSGSPAEDGGSVLRWQQFPSPCLLGGSFGVRQSDVQGTGVVSPMRPPGNRALTRGAVLLMGDIRPTYGVLRPHLLFCRFLN